jgi:hypothetical protein
MTSLLVGSARPANALNRPVGGTAVLGSWFPWTLRQDGSEHLNQMCPGRCNLKELAHAITHGSIRIWRSFKFFSLLFRSLVSSLLAEDTRQRCS